MTEEEAITFLKRLQGLMPTKNLKLHPSKAAVYDTDLYPNGIEHLFKKQDL